MVAKGRAPMIDDGGPDDWEDVPLEESYSLAEDGGPDDWEEISASPPPSRGQNAATSGGRYKPKYNWDDDPTKGAPKEKRMSMPESFARGARDSVSFGFDDEIGGAIAEIVPGGKGYKETRDEIRGLKKKAYDDNKLSYAGGALAGGLVVPGLGAAKGVGALGKLGSAVKSGAAYGAVSGLGGSEAEDVGGMAADTAKGGLMGGAIGGAFNVAGKAIQAPLGFIPDKLKEKVYRGIGEIDEDMADVIKSNPKLVEKSRNAKGSGLLADELVENLERLKDVQKKQSDEAWAALKKADTRGAKVPGVLLAREALGIAKENNLIGSKMGAQQSALKKLQGAMADVAKVQNYTDLKRAIQKIDDNINWDSQADKLSNKVLQRFRTALDQKLKDEKTGSAAYRQAMAPLADTTRAIQALSSKFGVKRGSEVVDDIPEPRLMATDRTISQMETARRQAFQDKGSVTRDVMKKQTPELLDDIEAAALQKYIEADIGRGSRSLVYGVGAGGLIPFIGPAAGAALGYARDKGGRAFAAEGLARIGERAQKIRNNSPPGPIRQILNKAFRTGGDGAVLMYHNLLMEKDPKYREAMSEY
jgi:hypothetical protein